MLAHNCHIHNIYTNVTEQRNVYTIKHLMLSSITNRKGHFAIAVTHPHFLLESKISIHYPTTTRKTHLLTLYVPYGIVVVCQLGFWCNIPPLLRTIGQ